MAKGETKQKDQEEPNDGGVVHPWMYAGFSMGSPHIRSEGGMSVRTWLAGQALARLVRIGH